MRVQVKGMVMEAGETKDKKDTPVYEIKLYQSGIDTLVRVRFPHGSKAERGKEVTVEGKLMAWKGNGDVQFMVMVQDVTDLTAAPVDSKQSKAS